MLSWGPSMDWFSIIKIDKDKVERTVKFLESGKKNLSTLINEIVLAAGREIWLDKKVPSTFKTRQLQNKNKYSRVLNVEEATFLSNFAVAGTKLLTLYEVPNSVKTFLNQKKNSIKWRRRSLAFQTNIVVGIPDKDFQIVYMAGYSRKKRGGRKPLKTNKIFIKTRLFSIVVEGCTINEFIALFKALKPILPSLNIWLARYDISYGTNMLDKKTDVTDLPVRDIIELYLFSGFDGPNPFNRKNDKDDKGGTVAA